MAGLGDDPACADLRRLVYEEGWKPVKLSVVGTTDTVTVEKDGEEQVLSSDHVAFHRLVEGLQEDFGLR